MSQNKDDKSHKGKSDTLLGDPMVNTKKGTNKAKATGQKDITGVNDIGIFEFIFEGLPNPPDLEGIDEDRLFELQNAVQEELRKRDKEREGVSNRTHLKPKRQRKPMLMIVLIIITTMIITLPKVKIKAADLLTVKVVTGNSEASHKEAEAKDLSITNANFKIIDFREVHLNITIINMAPTANPIFREIKQITTEDKAVAGVLSKLEDMVMVGPITRVTMALTSISIIHMISRQNSMAHPVVYAALSIIPLSTATKENMT